jgi:hypothetical protein
MYFSGPIRMSLPGTKPTSRAGLAHVPLNRGHSVMRGLVPRIHVFATGQDVDGRDVREDALRALARP